MFKNLKLQITPANVAFALALIALGALHFWHPELMGRAESLALFVAALLGSQVPPWFVAAEKAIEAVPAAPKPPRVPPAPPLAVFVLGALLGSLAPSAIEACTPQEQQQISNVITPATACVINVIDDVQGQIDIARTAATCGATVEDIYAIVQSLLASQPDAGAMAGAAPSAYYTHLHAWSDALKAAGAH